MLQPNGTAAAAYPTTTSSGCGTSTAAQQIKQHLLPCHAFARQHEPGGGAVVEATVFAHQLAPLVPRPRLVAALLLRLVIHAHIVVYRHCLSTHGTSIQFSLRRRRTSNKQPRALMQAQVCSLYPTANGAKIGGPQIPHRVIPLVLVP